MNLPSSTVPNLSGSHNRRPPLRRKINLNKNLKNDLKARLSGARAVAVLGIGSELLGDDAAGVKVSGRLAALSGKSGTAKFISITGGTAPESFTGEIKRFNPSHLVMVDCADMGKAPGEIVFLEPDKITGVSFSTHRMPLSIMMRYLKIFIQCELIVIGIQPNGSTLTFGGEISPEVKEAVDLLEETFREVMDSK